MAEKNPKKRNKFVAAWCWVGIALLQFLVLVSDIAVFGVVAFMLWNHFNLFTVIMSAIALKVWYDTGAFSAWRPSVVREFFSNARRMIER